MHLFLVDTSIFVFRSWFGPERFNPRGEPNQAVVGFCDFVYRLLSEQDPRRIVFAFDESLAQSERRRIYPDYKANRAPAPEELKRQFGWCRQWLEALGISCVSSRRWEADDLIGSLARFHRRPGLAVALLTADKDLAQLVEPDDLWWSYLDGRKLDYRGICRRFGVPPELIAEQLALTGDKVDNIPGIPRIGPKTAARLLKKFGSLENLCSRVDEVGQMKIRHAAEIRQALIDNRDLLELGLRLTRINCELEEMREVEIRRAAADPAMLQEIMDYQGFGTARATRWRDYLDSPMRRVD